MTQNTSTSSLFDRVCYLIAASTNDDGSPLAGKCADPRDVFGSHAIGEKELIDALGGGPVPEQWVMTVKIVCTAASAHHSFETLAKNTRRVKARLEHLARESERPTLIAELGVLGVILRNDRLPTVNVAELIAGAKDRKVQQCAAILGKLNRHREVLGEQPEELGVGGASTGEAIKARWAELDRLERADEQRVVARNEARARHLRTQEEYARVIDRKRGIRPANPRRAERPAPRGPVVETRGGETTRRIEKAKAFTMPDAE